ncbi:Panacea domain-containing protein [Neisseria sp. CCUG12390]|uniref:Panacea domain-containing protein n=1 Tax=Neisseria sp. CCUG12390 TaxID=3392035 RepID=UPI003A1011CA
MAISSKLDAIQKFIIQEHREQFDESPTPMKLQKLCYYAQGLSLGLNQAELFSDDFQAWQHGPVNPDLYSKYREYQWRPIDIDIAASEVLPTTEEQEHLRQVVAAFGKFDGAALSTMTHREQPWLEARAGIPESEGSRETIQKNVMRNYFSAKLREFEE